MPLVRIALPQGEPPAYATKLSKGVHRAMVETFNVPLDDYFQIVTELAAGVGLVGPAEYLGIAHTERMVIIQITCTEGRTLDVKKALYARIADILSSEAGLRREDIIINLVETKRENWSFGNGLAAYA